MKQPKSQACTLKWVYVFLILVLSAGVAVAQTSALPKKETAKHKIKPKPKKGSVTPPSFKIKIDTASFNLVSNAADVVGSYQPGPIKLKFIIEGNAPKTNVFETLVIEDHTTSANPQFNKIPTPSNTFTIPIDKSLFHGVGKPDTMKNTFTLVFKKAANEKGLAYIAIQGDTSRRSITVSFNPPPMPKRPAVTRLDSIPAPRLQLDTFKKGVDSPYAVKLKLKLAKGSGTNTSLPVTVDSVKNLKLSVGSLELALKDWNNKKDTVVTKSVTLHLQQIRPVTSQQSIHLKVDTEKNSQTLQLMPPKTKAKNTLINPIESGYIEIVSGKVGISHYFSTTVNSIDSINIKVRIFGQFRPNNDQFAFAFLDTNVAKHYQILENPITINEREWKNGLKSHKDSLSAKKITDTDTTDTIGYLNIPLHIKTINLNDSLNNVQYIDLIIRGQSTVFRGSQKIKLSVKDKPFWAEVGTNFDLLDKIKTNNFYAGVYMFDKDKGRLFGKKGENNLSFTGGVYESQAVSIGSTSNPVFNYRDAITPFKTYKDTGTITSTTTIKRIGIFLSPQIRLTHGETDENGIHFFISGYFEMLWQTIGASIDYSKQKNVTTDTGTVAAANYMSLPYKIQSLNYDYRSHYIGLGIPFYIKEKDFNLYINSVFGTTTQQFVIVSDNIDEALYKPIVPSTSAEYNDLLNFRQPKNGWNAFYLFQYRLNEVAYGLTFSGEVRGLLIPGSKPVITLALSKKFDLSALLKPLVAPF
jgi:hypothetical protein